MNIKALILFAGFLLPCFMAGAVTDSLGIKKEDGKKFIMHRVDQGETLYAISRRYKVDVEEIKETNPQTKDELVVGEVILVPLVDRKKQKQSDKYEYHTVKEEETLFSISQQYEVEVKQIKKWNDLSSNSIEVGQKLKVGKKSASPEKDAPKKDKGDTSAPRQKSDDEQAAASKQDKDDASDKQEEDAETNTTASKDTVENEEKEKEEMSEYEEKYVKKEKEIEGDKEGWVTKEQEGKATWISDRNMSTRKSLALHRSAPPGTVIRVENPQNDKVVYVKTVGMLNKDDDNTLITISQSAAKQLDVEEDFFRAKLRFSVKKESN